MESCGKRVKHTKTCVKTRVVKCYRKHRNKAFYRSNFTYLRVSFVLQVEHEKQLTHQALLRADTTERVTGEKQENMITFNCFITLCK